MTSADWEIVRLAAGWSAVICGLGLVLGFSVRRRSLRWGAVLAAVVGVVAFVVALVATARAMFLSDHDLHVVLVVSAVAGSVALGCGLFAARWLVRSARALRLQARLLGEDLPAASQLPALNGPAELREVADELRSAYLKLGEARDRERALESSRRELVAWVSHDLRTPLAGLRAMSEALEDGIAADPARYHARIRSEVERMTRMVDDLFELSRIQAGVLDLDLQPVSLGDVVSDVLASTGPIAAARGVSLGGVVDAGALVTADPSRLSRVVTNLVMNAIRHTPSEGSVEVAGRVTSAGIELTVLDQCGGIPDEELDRVFDVAWRGGHARTPEHEPVTTGAGLGLAVVQGIVTAHQGLVDVQNVPPGCRFRVLLPA